MRPSELAEETRRRSNWMRWAFAFALAVAVAALYALRLPDYLSWEYIREHLDILKSEVEQHRFASALVFFAAYVLVTALSVPVATGLTILGGALFGRWLGTALAVVAATAGASVAFLSSRYLLRDAVQRRPRWHIETIQRQFDEDGLYYLFTLRLLAPVPFFLINIAMGVTRVRLLGFAFVSLVGMLPATFLYANAGRELSLLARPRDVLSPAALLALGLLGVFPLAVRMFVRAARRQRRRRLD